MPRQTYGTTLRAAGTNGPLMCSASHEPPPASAALDREAPASLQNLKQVAVVIGPEHGLARRTPGGGAAFVAAKKSAFFVSSNQSAR